MADIALVKRNIGKMIDQSAPEEDIDAYIQSEGVTIDQLKAAPISPPPPTPEAAPREWSDIPGEALSNLLPSAVEFGKGFGRMLVSPVLDVKDVLSGEKPRTLTALGKTMAGGVQRATQAGFGVEPATDENTVFWDELMNYFSDRLGSVEAIKKTLATDPVGSAADLSTLLVGGGAGAGRLATLGEKAAYARALAGKSGAVSPATKVATATEKALKTGAKWTDPATVAMKTSSGLTNLAGKTLREVLGYTTGAGGDAIDAAFRGGENFTGAMRGKVADKDIVTTAKNALNEVRDQRGEAYRAQRGKIFSENQKSLDISPIKKQLDQSLSNFNIARLEDGSLDFSRFGVNREEIWKMKKFVKIVDEWGKKAGQRTPAGVDELKKTLSEFEWSSEKAAAFANSTINETKSVLNKNVPGYEGMTSAYAKASDTIKDIEQALSLGPQAGADTVLRKLMTTMKENPEFRKSLILKMEAASGQDIRGLVAGSQMKGGLSPRGTAILGGPAGVASWLSGNPTYFALLAAASPRAVGEFVNALGKGARFSKDVLDVTKPITRKIPSQALFQAGRATTILEEEDFKKMVEELGRR